MTKALSPSTLLFALCFSVWNFFKEVVVSKLNEVVGGWTNTRNCSMDSNCKSLWKKMIEKPYPGKPVVRFDEGGSGDRALAATPVLYSTHALIILQIERRNDMPLTKRKAKTVTFPLSVFETADTKEDLEDWLLSQNSEFIERMRKARRDDIQGKGKDWKSLKKELCIK